jgi:hypothetical protein
VEQVGFLRAFFSDQAGLQDRPDCFVEFDRAHKFCGTDVPDLP